MRQSFSGEPVAGGYSQHKLPEDHSLLSPENPLQAILEECEKMFGVYVEI